MEVLPWGGAREEEVTLLGGSCEEYTWLSHGSFWEEEWRAATHPCNQVTIHRRGKEDKII